MKKVDKYYDLIDEASMIYHEALGYNYLESLIKVSEGILDDNIDSKLDDDQVKRLEEIYKTVVSESFYNEEIRLAMELLIIKAFKHTNYSLDLMTPDSVNYLFAYIINRLFKDQEITILDTVLGTANLLQAISNNYSGVSNLIGIEKDEKLIEIAKISSNLQDNEIKIYYQDAINNVFDLVDIVIGDIEGYNYDNENLLYHIRYFPYLTILERLKNLKENGYLIYLIENNFFNQENVEKFKKLLEKEATLVGLIVLPKTMFKETHIGKSILIGKKAVLKSYDMMVLEIESFEENTLRRTLHKIDRLIEIL